jgi:hypothetical protein
MKRKSALKKNEDERFDTEKLRLSDLFAGSAVSSGLREHSFG